MKCYFKNPTSAYLSFSLRSLKEHKITNASAETAVAASQRSSNSIL